MSYGCNAHQSQSCCQSPRGIYALSSAAQSMESTWWLCTYFCFPWIDCVFNLDWFRWRRCYVCVLVFWSMLCLILNFLNLCLNLNLLGLYFVCLFVRIRFVLICFPFCMYRKKQAFLWQNVFSVFPMWKSFVLC